MDNFVLVDIGASGGAHRRWNRFGGHMTSILFEPDQNAFHQLNQNSPSNVQVINAAVLDAIGESQFYICRKQEVSSIFKPNIDVINLYPNPERYEIIDTQVVQTTSLDARFLEKPFQTPHFIKLDTQGSELLILNGGSRILNNVIGIEIEIWHVPVYQDVPLFPEIDHFLRAADFQIHDIVHYFWKRSTAGAIMDGSLGDMVSGEALYFRSPESLVTMISNGIFSLQQAITCYLAYGFTHLSEVLVNLAITEGLVNANQSQKISRLIRGFRKSKGLSWLPGSDIARWRLSHLTDRLLPKSGWVSKSKSELGSRYGTL